MTGEGGPGATVAVKDLTVRFGGVTALRGVSCELKGPGVIGLVGPNGSGKSTLAGVLSGLLKEYSGEVALNGRDLKRRNSIAVAKMGLRRTFQTVRLVETMTVYDNLLVGRRHLDRRQKQRLMEIVSEFGLTHYLPQWPDRIPGGIQRLVQVASVLLTNPSVVLFDEPAAGLTDMECMQLSAVISRYSKTALIILIEHNMNLIFDLCPRVIALINGQLVADGAPDEVRANTAFRTAYLGLSSTDTRPAPEESERAEA